MRAEDGAHGAGPENGELHVVHARSVATSGCGSLHENAGEIGSGAAARLVRRLRKDLRSGAGLAQR